MAVTRGQVLAAAGAGVDATSRVRVEEDGVGGSVSVTCWTIQVVGSGVRTEVDVRTGESDASVLARCTAAGEAARYEAPRRRDPYPVNEVPGNDRRTP